MSQHVAARYFDGRSAVATAITLSREGSDWRLRGEGVDLCWPRGEASLSERLGNTPRLLRHRNGAHCQIDDLAALAEVLGAAGEAPGLLEGAWHHWRWALVSVAGVVLSLFLAYTYLVPWSARQVAMAVPGEALQSLSRYTLESLDRALLAPSRGDRSRQEALAAAFAAQRFPDHQPLGYRIVFRSSKGLGANAFALPDGTLVVLDQLLALTQDDREILAVLAHEKGHVQQRHALRSALQSTVVGLVVAWYSGDVGSVVTTLPAMLLEARYSRTMEQEADDYASQVLRLNGDSPCRLASILKRLQGQARGADSGPDYFASHPATAERITALCPG